jgi:hypothetical protein
LPKSSLPKPLSFNGRQLMKDQRNNRAEERKFRRVFLRFGLETPEYRATGIQISTQGLFISTIHPVYPPDTNLMIEISTPNGPYTVPAIVCHAKKIPRLVVSNERCGMGVKFISPPKELLEFLASL